MFVLESKSTSRIPRRFLTEAGATFASLQPAAAGVNLTTPTKFYIICSSFSKTKTAKSLSSPMSSQHHPIFLRRCAPSSSYSLLETHHLSTVAPTHAGQHHLILHARDAQGCGNNAFALVFQKRKYCSHQCSSLSTHPFRCSSMSNVPFLPIYHNKTFDLHKRECRCW